MRGASAAPSASASSSAAHTKPSQSASMSPARPSSRAAATSFAQPTASSCTDPLATAAATSLSGKRVSALINSQPSAKPTTFLISSALTKPPYKEAGAALIRRPPCRFQIRRRLLQVVDTRVRPRRLQHEVDSRGPRWPSTPQIRDRPNRPSSGRGPGTAACRPAPLRDRSRFLQNVHFSTVPAVWGGASNSPTSTSR